ncbi:MULTISPECIES: lytic transglycosylase F [Aeromonas]|uniref:transglycosylase SLT domain-containing protein n=1 Tax=Aeromonas TaxID=642 RepID=UPI0015DC157A|nr:lytic transglycosylase F [Aeromonas media]MBP8080088.1 lytic transglycosylase F [Aeromonas sp.]MBP9677927.1 lytic transglycosylase F [Aeromonas sp.]BBS87052.1 peptidoglycan lytic exotransglycosylase [Aeromonas media]
MKRLWIVMVWMLCSLAPVWSAEPEKKVTVEEEEERSALAFDSAELAKPMQGDFDAMLERRTIRVLTTYNKTGYFIHKGVQRGVTYDAFIQVEKRLNEQLRKDKAIKRHLKVHIVFIPVAREALLASLIEGKGDIAAANLTITDKRKQQGVEFTDPLLENVRELLISGPHSPKVESAADLGGKTIFVRPSSSYFESLMAYNQARKEAGEPLIDIQPASEVLEDEDLVEMVNAGLLPFIVMDEHKARFWQKIFPKITIHETPVFREGGVIAWAVRKESPKLLAMLNQQIKAIRGKATGEEILARYLKQNKFVKSAAAAAERKKFLQVVELFREYGDRYDVDWLLMAAQGYQESALNQKARSHVGAIGIMQIMPATGKGLKVGDIRQLEPNIHGGAKYMRWMIDHYYADEPMTALDKALFSFASYNAGPARVARLRAETKKRGMDPNVWFHNVEYVAAEKIGPETVTYVGNIYKYYIAYKLVMEQMQLRQKASEALQQQEKVSAAKKS